VSKFKDEERKAIQNIGAKLSIKLIPYTEIIEEVRNQTDKMITRQTLYNTRQQIKFTTLGWIFFLDFVRIQLGIHFYNKIVYTYWLLKESIYNFLFSIFSK
jgi:hypothetical protein